ncbi:hypothetical protein Scep_014184 [Stephania cephalantha]|uniref:Uncharacterized protein n=1 Tax=Stephania cephalantha TaxID=152367 RepID=A0AAP0J0U8_9MAGN
MGSMETMKGMGAQFINRECLDKLRLYFNYFDKLVRDVGFKPMEDEDAEDAQNEENEENEEDVDQSVEENDDDEDYAPSEGEYGEEEDKNDQEKGFQFGSPYMENSNDDPNVAQFLFTWDQLMDGMEEESGGNSDNMEENPKIPYGFGGHVVEEEHEVQTVHAETETAPEDAHIAEFEAAPRMITHSNLTKFYITRARGRKWREWGEKAMT